LISRYKAQHPKYSGNSFAIDKNKPTISYKYGDRKGEAVDRKGGMEPFGMSSMDVYQMCKMYECETCAGIEIPTYDGNAHESYMYTCKNTK